MLRHSLADKLAEYIVVKNEIEGMHAGGSGHVADVSLSVECIIQEESESAQTNLSIAYRKTVVTEFTCLPDNPPYESLYRISVNTDQQGNVLKEGEKEYISEMDLWEMVKKSIASMAEYILLKIECCYGSNRAPFRYPPIFLYSDEKEPPAQYSCVFESDLPVAGNIEYKGSTPGELYRNIMADLPFRFLDV